MTISRRSRHLHDLYTLTKRNIIYSIRNIDTLITTIVLPIVMMLLFVFVFGGAMNVGESIHYVDYVTPAIILLCIGYCAATTSVSIQADMQAGMVTRFRSMSISRSCILAGQVTASVIKNVLSTIIVMLVALLIGFRPTAGLSEWRLIAVLLLAYTLAFTWVALLFGLVAKTPESASVFGTIALFLPYLSSAFVPIETMPYALQVFARYQPFTPITDTLRYLAVGIVDKTTLAISVAWIVGIGIAAYFVSLFVYQNKQRRL